MIKKEEIDDLIKECESLQRGFKREARIIAFVWIIKAIAVVSFLTWLIVR